MAEEYSTTYYVYVYRIFIDPFVNGHLGCFPTNL